MKGPKPKPPEERFWPKVNKRGPKILRRRCWIWEGTGGRYGCFSFSRRKAPLGAHVVSFFFKHGRWPKPCCLHRCDNPRCVRPSHLFEGSQKDNAHDRDAKGHTVFPPLHLGEKNHKSKLTRDDVIRIRGMSGSNAQIGRLYGVSTTSIWQIKKRRVWRHV